MAVKKRFSIFQLLEKSILIIIIATNCRAAQKIKINGKFVGGRNPVIKKIIINFRSIVTREKMRISTSFIFNFLYKMINISFLIFSESILIKLLSY